MNQNDYDFLTGIEFARAVAKHFKLPDTTDANMEMVTGANDVFGVRVNLTLTADDLAAIADLMPGRSSSALVEFRLSEFLGDAPAPAVALDSAVVGEIGQGDLLVVTVPHAVSREQRDRMRADIRKELDCNVRILIADGGSTIAVMAGPAVVGDGITGD